MLLTSFFQLKSVEKSGNTVLFAVLINPRHEVFKGHFPQQPVVPGVFTLQMIKECTELFLDRKWRYSELSNCKFLRPILPGHDEEIKIRCEYTLENDTLQLKANVASGEFDCLSLKATLIEPNTSNYP
ncbi:MAG: hydroxymyristoyl-ACP dehydratase [Dysgonamonadaceae bacterium]|jgi:3-hydroxyacyl-[acyl-carrier-protein] dehydratase|nr:hydroxymyristoyl-ACP dehydratase [Dysgonamonadaceae bacterium]